tara:strand:+ start:111 stop:893 length:783 start_codon:yes stop_codon:yes gene_type:complete
MAETLTYENAVEATSIDNLNADEQDSLEVGEKMQAAEEQLLAGKYKNAEELEKAHIELQKKLGENKSEPEAEEDSQDPPESKKDEEDKPSESTVLDQLWEEAQSGEKFSDETLSKLTNSNPADLAQQYLELRSQTQSRDLTKEDVTELHNVAGGEQEYSRMLDWANKNLNKQEIDMFDTVMERGDPLAAFFAVRSLAYRYEDSTTGRQGKMITGTAPKSSGDQFRSQAEVVKAMSDPRYDDDPAYRQDIMRKLERSDVNF